MKKKNYFIKAAMLFFIAFPAYAYIDPSIGSLWVQCSVAFFIGIMAAIKLYWQKFKSLIKKKSRSRSFQDLDKKEVAVEVKENAPS